MATQKTRTQTQYRDSRDGKFITEGQAKRSPDTTEKERIKHPVTPPKKK